MATAIPYLGRNFAYFRKKRNMTQEELAEQLDISINHISHIETGARNLSLEKFVKALRILNIEPNDLLLGAYPMSKKDFEDKLSETAESDIIYPADQVTILELKNMLDKLNKR